MLKNVLPLTLRKGDKVRLEGYGKELVTVVAITEFTVTFEAGEDWVITLTNDRLSTILTSQEQINPIDYSDHSITDLILAYAHLEGESWNTQRSDRRLAISTQQKAILEEAGKRDLAAFLDLDNNH